MFQRKAFNCLHNAIAVTLTSYLLVINHVFTCTVPQLYMWWLNILWMHVCQDWAMKLKGISEHLLSSEMINIGYARFTHVAKDANKIHEIVRMTIRIL